MIQSAAWTGAGDGRSYEDANNWDDDILGGPDLVTGAAWTQNLVLTDTADRDVKWRDRIVLSSVSGDRRIYWEGTAEPVWISSGLRISGAGTVSLESDVNLIMHGEILVADADSRLVVTGGSLRAPPRSMQACVSASATACPATCSTSTTAAAATASKPTAYPRACDTTSSLFGHIFWQMVLVPCSLIRSDMEIGAELLRFSSTSFALKGVGHVQATGSGGDAGCTSGRRGGFGADDGTG